MDPGQRLGPFEVIEELGRGGMGVVYKAYDHSLHRVVALKVLPPDFVSDAVKLKRFKREARAAASLQHPNICPVFEFKESGGYAYLAMAYVEGENLSALVESCPLEIGRALDIAIHVARGLAYAHGKQIVHRDITPPNIIVDSTDFATIIDFGLAQVSYLDRLSQEGTVVGTEPYMSPEQIDGVKLDSRSDIWTLGVVLYEMVTGVRPFTGEYRAGLIYSIQNENPRPIASHRPEIPGDLDRVVSKALEKDKGKRYSDIDELIIELRSIRQRVGPGSAQSAVIDLSRASQSDGPPTVAVLPFLTHSDDLEHEALSLHICESLTNNLGRVDSLSVCSLTSVLRYKDHRRTLREIANELNVDFLVEGSLFVASGQVVVFANLVDVKNDQIVGSRTYKREAKELLKLVRGVTRQIAKMIQVDISPASVSRDGRCDSIHPDALKAITVGRFFWNRRTRDDLEKAISQFERATKIVPTSALAYVGLADSLALLGSHGLQPANEVMSRAYDAAEEAVKMDQGLAEAYCSLAFITAVYRWDLETAERLFSEALRLNPGYATAHHWYAIACLVPLGRFDEASAEIKRAADLDPLSLMINTIRGVVCYYNKEIDRAISIYRQALDLDPNFAILYRHMGFAYLEKGLYSESISHFKAQVALSARVPEARANLALAYGAAGRTRDAEKILAHVLEERDHAYVRPTVIAAVLARLGRAQGAIEWLRRALEERDPSVVWIGASPLFSSLRNESAFRILMGRIGLPGGESAAAGV